MNLIEPHGRRVRLSGVAETIMSENEHNGFIIEHDDVILVTGATGFIGPRVIKSLLDRGFQNIRCFTRPSSDAAKTKAVSRLESKSGVQMFRGNLLSPEDCYAATEGVAVIIHLAAGSGENSYPDAFSNSVVTTRNLLHACVQHNSLKRFVNVSSFAVYTNTDKPHRNLLDETCPIEVHPERRGDPYCFAKVKQDEIVVEYGQKHGIPYVFVRPGSVYGQGKEAIPSRVGIGTFGVFLHLGGANPIPFTYVENCADAIALAGLVKGIDGEAFNIVDDDLPSSRRFLRLYKRNVKSFTSIFVPRLVSYGLCYLWENYSNWSYGQLPPAFNRARWHSFWKKTRYSNDKIKNRLGWKPKVPTSEGLQRYFDSCREGKNHA
jgi:nucleoside-diphosphate-sugar epimerase